MMKMRFALTATPLSGTALVLLGFAALSSAAEAQAVSGQVYYQAAPQPAYVAPPPGYAYPPAYYYPAPAYYYAPAPVYYYPQPVYYPQPAYIVPGVSATFVFGGGGGHGHGHGGHH